MNKLEYWKLCDDFTVVQAALIVCGIPPEEQQWAVERKSDSQCPPGYVAIRTAFRHALMSGKMKPTKVAFHFTDEGEETRSIDIESTTVSAAEVDRYLKSVGAICEFFDQTVNSADNSAAFSPEMPPKLKAAVEVWSAVSRDAGRLRGKSPKQAMDQWLTENAERLGLLNRDGSVNRTGIDEICKVANWKPQGGATPTPSSESAPPLAEPTRSKRSMMRLPPPRAGFVDLDDEIPF